MRVVVCDRRLLVRSTLPAALSEELGVPLPQSFASADEAAASMSADAVLVIAEHKRRELPAHFRAAWYSDSDTVRDIARRLMEAVVGGGETPPVDVPTVALTPREATVLSMLAQGMSSGAIASDLSISVRTVDHYKGSLYVKLGVNSQSHAVARALELKLLDGENS